MSIITVEVTSTAYLIFYGCLAFPTVAVNDGLVSLEGKHEM